MAAAGTISQSVNERNPTTTNSLSRCAPGAKTWRRKVGTDSPALCGKTWQNAAGENRPRRGMLCRCGRQGNSPPTQNGLSPSMFIDFARRDAPPPANRRARGPFLGGDDPVFGFLCGLTLGTFFDPARVANCGPGLLRWSKVWSGCRLWRAADRPWRYSRLCRLGEVGSADAVFAATRAATLACKTAALSAGLAIQARFLRRLAGLRRLETFADCQMGLCLGHQQPAGTEAGRGRRGPATACAARPTGPSALSRFLIPAPWGGQWMKEVCGLDGSVKNYGWCFDCVPEENSLLLGFGNLRFELPSVNLVFASTARAAGRKSPRPLWR